MVKREVDAHFLKINATIYDRRGLEWYVIDGHYWIELRIYIEKGREDNRRSGTLPTT